MSQGIVDHDTVHHLFPGLNKLLDFQRKFSIELEHQYELPSEQQRWGRCFSINVRISLYVLATTAILHTLSLDGATISLLTPKHGLINFTPLTRYFFSISRNPILPFMNHIVQTIQLPSSLPSPKNRILR
jgi:hypothetical protein